MVFVIRVRRGFLRHSPTPLALVIDAFAFTVLRVRGVAMLRVRGVAIGTAVSLVVRRLLREHRQQRGEQHG